MLKRKLAGKSPVLTPPVVIGMLISYRGFKELAFVASDAGDVWAIDADMDRIFWEKHPDARSIRKSRCAGPVAMPALVPPVVFRPRPVGAAPRPAGPAPTPFGAARPLFVVSADGKLHRLNTSDGSDQQPPVDFLPAGARASALTIADGVLYATAQLGCGAKATGLVASMDVSKPEQNVARYNLPAGTAEGLGGLAVGTDGTVYVQTGSGAVSALSTGDLKPKQNFQADAPGANAHSQITPTVFEFKGRDLIVTAAADGRLYLIDSDNFGGDDHKTYLHRTEPVAGRLWGGLSTWTDPAGVRWVAAPVWDSGTLATYQVEEHDGKPILTPAWVAKNISSPLPPVVTGGYVFVLSAGEYNAKMRPKGGSHATLFVLDAATGKQIYSTGSQVSAPANLTGITLVNGRAYFTTADSTLYAFGIPLER